MKKGELLGNRKVNGLAVLKRWKDTTEERVKSASRILFSGTLIHTQANPGYPLNRKRGNV